MALVNLALWEVEVILNEVEQSKMHVLKPSKYHEQLCEIATKLHYHRSMMLREVLGLTSLALGQGAGAPVTGASATPEDQPATQADDKPAAPCR